MVEESKDNGRRRRQDRPILPWPCPMTSMYYPCLIANNALLAQGIQQGEERGNIPSVDARDARLSQQRQRTRQRRDAESPAARDTCLSQQRQQARQRRDAESPAARDARLAEQRQRQRQRRDAESPAARDARLALRREQRQQSRDARLAGQRERVLHSDPTKHVLSEGDILQLENYINISSLECVAPKPHIVNVFFKTIFLFFYHLLLNSMAVLLDRG